MTTTAPVEPFEGVMSDSDSIMWTIERDPILRSTVTAVSVLDRAPDWSRAVRRMETAAVRIPRLRQRVRTFPFHLGRPDWVEADTDIGYHFRRIALPPGGSFADVLEIARVMAMAAFDPTRPLWEFVVVEGVDGARAALVQKFHHTVTDGVGGVRLALELLDDEPEPGVRDGPGPASEVSRTDPVGAVVAQRTQRAAAITRAVPKLAIRTAHAVVRDPAGTISRATETARSVAHMVAPAPTPMSPILRGRGQSWALRCFDVELDALRRAAKRNDASINDVFVAAASLGLERYHAAAGATPAMLRMTMPMSIRRAGDPAGGNRFTPLRFAIPVSGSAGDDRIRAMRDVIQRERGEPAVALTPLLAAALDTLPAPILTPVFGGMLKNIDFVATNVPGIPFRCWFAGAEVLRQYAFAPPSGAALNIALLSHLDTACIGVVADTTPVTDVDRLVEALHEGFSTVVERRARRAS